VGYFLLTGRPVFDAGGVMEIMRAHVEKAPLPPSKRLARPMSAELEQVILRCLAKSPEARPQSAAALAAELADCLPVQPWTTTDADSWWRQNGPTLAAPADGGRSDVTQDIGLASTLGVSDVKPAN
jgi:serine/threonine protein kinase